MVACKKFVITPQRKERFNMKIADTLRRAGRSLKQAKARTLLTSLAIAVGAFTIMMSLAAGEGTRNYSNNLIQSNVDPQALFIVQDDSLFESGGTASTGLREYDADVSEQGGRSLKLMNQEAIDGLAARDDLTDVTPTYQLSVRSIEFSQSDTRYSAEVAAYNPDVISEVAAGKLPEKGTSIAADEIVLPEGFATTLGVSPEELIGNEVRLTIVQPSSTLGEAEAREVIATEGVEGLARRAQGETRTITTSVVAVTKQSSTSFTATTAASVSAETAKEIAEFTTEGTDSYQKYLGVTAKAAEGYDPAKVKAELESEGFSAQTAEDLQSLIFTIVNVLQYIVAGFGILALLASLFGIINTQYISVLERTSQIGLMKALGMRGRDVSRLFRYEAAWIGFLGGVIGIGLAALATALLNPFINKTLELGEGNYLLAFVPWHALVLLACLILIAIAAGYFPSRKAAKLDPIEALRTE